MLLGIISDTHDNLPMTRKALKVLEERGADMLMHCGDFVAPFTLGPIVESRLPLKAVYGNNDGEKTGLANVCGGIQEGVCRIKLNGRSIVMAHEPERLMAEMTARDDVGLCGHTHRPEINMGPPLIVNPGETGGWLTGRCSVAVLDLKDMTAELIELGEQRRC